MTRHSMFYGRGKLLGGSFVTNDVSDDQTSMAEICKRFFNNEPIPQDLQDKNYEYGSQDIKLDDGNTFDPLTREIISPNGEVIRVDLSAPDILSTIPITPNLDFVDPMIGVNECGTDIDTLYSLATDHARSVVRGYQLEQKAKTDAKLKASLELAKSRGLITEQLSEVNAPVVSDSSNS